jgi:hypothetical protein
MHGDLKAEIDIFNDRVKQCGKVLCKFLIAPIRGE